MKIFNLFHNNLVWMFFCSTIIGQGVETAFIKYYRSDRDFIADVPLLATVRVAIPHLEVTFNEHKQPVLKRWLDNDHTFMKEEMFVYDKTNALKKRLILNDIRRTEKIFHYGEKEPWSIEFRKFTRNEQTSVSYTGQQTEFILNGKNVISAIRFRTVNGHEYGTISLSYDHLGFLQEEIWRTLPEEEMVRKYVYDIDIMNDVKQIWEYSAGDYLVSHVALSMAPEDKLYTTPPPRTGNVLNEAEIILKELESKRIISTVPAFIPYTEWDRLILGNDETMDIVYIAIDGDQLRFSIPNEPEVLSISLTKVTSIRNKFGELVYP